MTVGPTMPKMTMEESRRWQPKMPTVYPTPDGKRFDSRSLTAQRNNDISRGHVHRFKRPSHGGMKIHRVRYVKSAQQSSGKRKNIG